MEVYFDNAATTAVYPEVKELMVRLMEEDYGNPSSLHMKGITAENYIKEARNQIAHHLKCQEKELVFTSGGTESNNLAILGGALAKRRAGKHIITTGIEHASVRETVEFLSKEGFEISDVDVDGAGRVDLEHLKALIREDTILVSTMYVNNEIGTIEPIADIARLVHEESKSALYHVDGVQAFGKLAFSPKKLGVDLLSISGHKIHGPKGSGALYIKDGVRIRPIIYGGGQQKAMRSGTENVPAIAGMGLASDIIYTNHGERIEKIRGLKECFLGRVTKLDNVFDNSGDAPHIASVSFVGVRSEVMLHALEERGIYVSAGSACSSNKPHASNVLTAIKLPEERLESTLRFSFSEFNTMDELDYALNVIEELLPTLRRYVRK
ncbi:MAG: cysteine desulfurase [Clostridium sp.]|nr:cysteine desulfurase [Clostridium sp.]MCM1398091.1 cysteine desulfurase [Clostridium sp.]MCM1459275.1 cysteine desulfurase [Bacteroides sp.]